MNDKITKLLGAPIGDIVGSIYEFDNSPKCKVFDIFQKDMFFTDDTALTIAVAEVLLRHYPIDYSNKGLEIIKKDLISTFIKYVKKYNVSWGTMFYEWALFDKDHKPYNSWGNGSAMRISPVGWIANSKDEVIKLSKAVSEITHNHLDGLKGAEATAMCIYLAKTGYSKEDIYKYVIDHYYPEIQILDYDELVKNYKFDVSAEGTVPVAIYAFYISNSLEDCLRNSISIGGDADTLAAISCSIAEAYYKNQILDYKEDIYKYLPIEFQNIINSFNSI